MADCWDFSHQPYRYAMHGSSESSCSKISRPETWGISSKTLFRWAMYKSTCHLLVLKPPLIGPETQVDSDLNSPVGQSDPQMMGNSLHSASSFNCFSLLPPAPSLQRSRRESSASAVQISLIVTICDWPLAMWPSILDTQLWLSCGIP